MSILGMLLFSENSQNVSYHSASSPEFSHSIQLSTSASPSFDRKQIHKPVSIRVMLFQQLPIKCVSLSILEHNRRVDHHRKKTITFKHTRYFRKILG